MDSLFAVFGAVGQPGRGWAIVGVDWGDLGRSDGGVACFVVA